MRQKLKKSLRQFAQKQQEKRKDHKGENNPNFRGGVRRLGSYYYVYSPGHSRAIKYGQTPYVLRSVVNLEKKLGRKLKKDELPHHRDGNKLNDSFRNLELMTQADHRRHHSVGKPNEVRAQLKTQTDRKAESFDKRTPDS